MLICRNSWQSAFFRLACKIKLAMMLCFSFIIVKAAGFNQQIRQDYDERNPQRNQQI